MRTLLALAALAALMLAPRLALAASTCPDAGLVAPGDLGVTALEQPTTPVVALPAQLAAPAPSAVTWLRAAPLGWPNWQVIAAVLWLVVTAVLKNVRSVRANEPLELLANLLVRVPLVGWIARAWTTPGTPTPTPASGTAAGAAAALALLLAPSLAFADCFPTTVFREVEHAPYIIAGLWTGTFLTARCWRYVEARTEAIRRRAARWTPRVMLPALALLSVWMAVPTRAFADGTAPAPVHASLVLPATQAAPSPPPLSEAERVAAIAAGVKAGLEQAQAGVQASPVLKSWAETKAGQVVMGCIAGAIVITSAAGAAAGVVAAVR